MAIILALAGFCVQAAATLPIIAALSLIAGRRGNARICLAGGLELLNLDLFLAATGPIFYLGSYWQQMLPYGTNFAQRIAPLFMPAGMNWSGSTLIWLAGILAGFPAIWGIRLRLQNLRENTSPVRLIRVPLFFCFLCAFLFFSTFIVINWPFGGLPEVIGWDRAALALWRNAVSNYFLALSSAGAAALLLLALRQQKLPENFVPIATRWLAFWGLAGSLPYLLTRWGYIIGAFRARGSLAYGLQYQTISLSLLTAAAFCCALLLWKPRFLLPLAWATILLLLGRALLPLLV